MFAALSILPRSTSGRWVASWRSSTHSVLSSPATPRSTRSSRSARCWALRTRETGRKVSAFPSNCFQGQTLIDLLFRSQIGGFDEFQVSTILGNPACLHHTTGWHYCVLQCFLTTCHSGEQGGSELDGGYAEVGSQEKAKCRKSSPLSLLPGALLETYIFARFDLIWFQGTVKQSASHILEQSLQRSHARKKSLPGVSENMFALEKTNRDLFLCFPESNIQK